MCSGDAFTPLQAPNLSARVGNVCKKMLTALVGTNGRYLGSSFRSVRKQILMLSAFVIGATLARPREGAMALDPNLCPLCGGANECAMAAGQGEANSCWCWSISVAVATLERVPEAARAIACVCRRCADAGASRGSAGSPAKGAE